MIGCFRKKRHKKIVPDEKPIVKQIEESLSRKSDNTSSTKSEEDVIREFESLYE